MNSFVFFYYIVVLVSHRKRSHWGINDCKIIPSLGTESRKLVSPIVFLKHCLFSNAWCPYQSLILYSRYFVIPVWKGSGSYTTMFVQGKCLCNLLLLLGSQDHVISFPWFNMYGIIIILYLWPGNSPCLPLLLLCLSPNPIFQLGL